MRLSFRGFRPDSAIIRTMFRVGVPAILVQALATVMNLGMNLILPLFTASGVFILGAYFKLQSFLFMPVNGLNNALIPIVSFNYGARQRSRITGVIHFALVLSAAIMAVGTVVFKCPLPTGPEAAASGPVFSFKRDFDPTLLTV